MNPTHHHQHTKRHQHQHPHHPSHSTSPRAAVEEGGGGDDAAYHGHHEAIPPSFVCPLSGHFMEDPVLDRCGHTFERSAVTKWLQSSGPCCPISRKPLHESDLQPNHILGERMDQWKWRRDFLLPLTTTTTTTTTKPHHDDNHNDNNGDSRQMMMMMPPHSHQQQPPEQSPEPTVPVPAEPNASATVGDFQRNATSTPAVVGTTPAKASSTQRQPPRTDDADEQDDECSRSSTCRSSDSDEEQSEGDEEDGQHPYGRSWDRRQQQRQRQRRMRRNRRSLPPEFMLLPQERQALEWWQERAGRESERQRRAQCHRRLFALVGTMAVLLLLVILGVGVNRYLPLDWFRGFSGGSGTDNDEAVVPPLTPGNATNGSSSEASSTEAPEPPKMMM